MANKQKQNAMIWVAIAIGGLLGYWQAGDGAGAFFGSAIGAIVLVIYFAAPAGKEIVAPQTKPTIEGVKCPTCQSSSVERITAGKKLGHVLAFGIFAPAFKKVRSQFECKSCGYKW